MPKVIQMQVGDKLADVISSTFGIPKCQRCIETAKRMNELGVDGCREQVAELAEALHQNAMNVHAAAVEKNEQAKAEGKEPPVSKWSVMVAKAAKYAAKAAHAIGGNAMYRQIILDVCDYVEKQNHPCVYRGEQVGSAPWNKKLPLFECGCEMVNQLTCIVQAENNRDAARSAPDNVAICSTCEFNRKQETKHD